MDNSSTDSIVKNLTSTQADWLSNNFAQFEKSLNGDVNLPFHDKRKAAFSDYLRLGFPNTSQEEWKYTNPMPIKERAFPIFVGKVAANASPFKLNSFFTPGLNSIRVAVLNGCLESWDQKHLADSKNAGLKITTLSDILKSGGELSALVEKHLASHAGNQDAFVAINTSLMNNAIVIHLTRGTKLSSPIEIVFATDAEANKTTILPRILILAEADTESNIIEQYCGENGEYSINSVLEFVIAERANISHFRIQKESVNAFYVSTIAATIDSYSQFSTFTFSFGGKLVRNNVNITLAGSNCNINMDGLTAIAGKQHVDNHTLLDNTKPNCESHELYKGIYADASQGVFSGSIIVRQDAQKTNAIQSNKSLLLSDQAAVNSKPQLKIWADDVKCTHGATIGQLDDDALFYIRSRGVSEKDAILMLVHAFASEVISRVKVEPLRKSLEDSLLEKLNLVSG